MNTLSNIQTKKLFLIVALVKIISSVATLFLSGGRLDIIFWIFALCIPMLAFGIYIYGGFNRVDRTLTDEKFADSCYYLGFIFTIVSIVISLFDLPNIGDSMSQISVRFGVAMVSTAVGLLVRVYLINFKIESNDAVTIIEDALIRASEKFTHQLGVATENYSRFEASVNTSTNNIVEHIGQRIERMAEDYSNRLDEHFKTSTESFAKLTKLALEDINKSALEVQSASSIIKTEVESIMKSFGEELDKYARNLTLKLESTVLPNDFFTSKLSPSIDKIKLELDDYVGALKASTQNVSSISKGITEALSAMNRRSQGAVNALDRLERAANDSKVLTESVQALVKEINALSSNVLEGLQRFPGISELKEISALHVLKLEELQGNQNQQFTASLFNLSDDLRQIPIRSDEKMEEVINRIENSVVGSIRGLVTLGEENLREITELKNEFNQSIASLNLTAQEIQRDSLVPLLQTVSQVIENQPRQS